MGRIGENRVPYRFATDAGPGTKGELKIVLPADGTIERMLVRIYGGPELSLHIIPMVRRKGGSLDDIVHYVEGGKQYLDGDDDRLEYNLSMKVYQDEELVVKYENLAAVETYAVVVDIEVDYDGGVKRLY